MRRNVIRSSVPVALLLLTLPAVVQSQNLTYTTNNGAITITGHTGSAESVTNVTIPENINQLPVTTIGTGAFSGCNSLTNLRIGSNVTSIEFEAFIGCSSLASVTIPNSVTNVGLVAFQGCGSLTNVTIGTRVASIGNQAFFDCSSLTSISIPSSVTNIGVNVFTACSSLSAITVAALNSSYSSVNGVLFDKSQRTLIEYPGGRAGSYTIPNGVSSIAQSAFASCVRLTTVTIANSVTKIGDDAFWSCISLTNVTIGPTVTSIGKQEFSGCSSLSAITVDTLNSSYSSLDGVLFNKNQTTLVQYPASRAGISYTIPNSVTNIAEEAFYNSGLTNVIIPSGVISIGEGAFYECYRLTSVAIPNTVTSIGADAFGGCGGITSLSIPNSVTSIGDLAFEACGLTNVMIGTNVTSIGYLAFRNCTWLTNVCFGGNAPSADETVFEDDNNTTVYYLSGATGWGSTFGGRPTMLWFSVLQVSISPPGAVSAGAQWQVDGGPWQSSMMTVSNLSVDNHTIAFSSVSGWTTPADQTVSVFANQTTTATGTYIQIAGSLQVNITPSAAVSAGALWQLDGGSWYGSGAMVSGLSLGSHMVNFKTISGWNTPTSQRVTINYNSTTTTSGTYVDAQPPLVNITNITAGMNVSNATFTVMGTAIDNLAVSNVLYSLNNAAWTNAGTINNWANWTAAVHLIAGSNTIQAYAVDTSGNVSVTTSVSFNAVLSTGLTVSTNGLGSLNPNYNNVLLQVGKRYSITATAGTGFVFTNWTGGITVPLAVLTNGATLQFVMQSNLMLQANFVDTSEPTLSITNVVSGQRVSNAVFTVKGKANDNWQVANVQYQLDGGDWASAAGTTNWSATVNLIPGTNHVQAYAVDNSGNHSLTNSVLLDYVVTNQLEVAAVGLGTLSPNYSNAWLEVGRKYSMTATANTGFAFSKWTISTNWIGGRITNNATVQFMMESNLTLQVTFAEVTKPTLTITAPANGQRMTNALAHVKGTASDNWRVVDVWYQLNGGCWNPVITTNAWANWFVTLPLLSGTNTVKAYAVDLGGNASTTNAVSVTCSNTFKLQLSFASASPMASNGLSFNLDLSSGINGTIEVSSNLVNWTVLTSFAGTNATLNFHDSAATNFNQRFYRAVTQ